jgi:hypothetical protein
MSSKEEWNRVAGVGTRLKTTGGLEAQIPALASWKKLATYQTAFGDFF